MLSLSSANRSRGARRGVFALTDLSSSFSPCVEFLLDHLFEGLALQRRQIRHLVLVVNRE